jgi:hypothetical protein
LGFPYRDGSVRFPAASISQNVSEYTDDGLYLHRRETEASLQQICNKRDAKMRPIPSNPSLLEIAISACGNSLLMTELVKTAYLT